MKIWVTKDALSLGIREVTGAKISNNIASWTEDGLMEYAHRKYWHTVRERAVAQAETMRTKRIAALQRQISKLEKMSFT